jgi:PAS domain S-box-containing protein
VVFRVKLLTLTMTGILLVGIIPLAVTSLRRGQLRDEMIGELNTLGKSECAKVAKDVYLMLRAQHEKLKKEVRYDLNVAGYVMAEAGGFSLAHDRIHWTATDQSSGRSIQIDLTKALVGNRWIGQNTDPAVPSPIVDKVRELVGARCTIFQRMNDSGDLLRVCTNVLKKDGARAIGTYIPATEPDGKPNPVVAAVLRGETYVGRAHVVDDWYLTAYEPIYDAKRAVVGALFCGVRLEDIPELRKGIVDITVGRTGYAYVLGGSGSQKGRYIISRRGLRDGEYIYDSQDASGKYFIRSIIDEALQTENGDCKFARYAWRNPGEESPRLKVVAATYFEPWDWVIGVGTYEDDFQAAIARIDDAASKLIFWGTVGAFVAFVLCSVLAWVESGRIAAMNHEIAHRKQAEEIAHNNEAKYKTLYDSSGDAIMYARPDAGMLAGNTATIKLFGCRDEKEFVSFNPADLSPECQPDGTLSAVKAQEMMAIAMERGSHFFEWRHRRVDGSEFPATVLLTRIELEGRTVLLTTVRDITSQKEAERALRESERRLANIIDFLPDATFAIDREGKVIAWNRAIEEMTGVPAERMLGQGDYAYAVPFYGEARPLMVDLIFKEDKEIEKHYCSIVRKGTQLIGESPNVILHDGTGAHLWIIAAPLYDSGGRMVGAIESIRDISEQRWIQEELKKSEKRFMDVLYASSDAMLLFDVDRFIDCNDAAARLLGYPNRNEFLVATPAELSPPMQPDGRSSVEKAKEMMQIAAQRGTHHFEWIHRKISGEEFPVEVTLTAIVVRGRIQLLCVWRDVTEQKRAQKALEESERRLAAIIDFLPDGTIAIDRESRVIAWNRALEKLTGVPASEMLGKGDYAYGTPFYGEAQPILIDLVFGGHEDQWKDYNLIDRKGDEVIAERFVPCLRGGKGAHVWGFASPLRDGEGGIVGAIALFRDITEQKRAEDALLASETKYRTLYDASSDAIMLRTPDRRVVGANRAAVALFGYADENELKAVDPADLYAEYQPDGRPSSEKSPQMAEIALRDGSYNFEWKYRRKDGAEFLANVLWTKMELEGNPILLTTIRDVTEQRRAEEALRASERRLRLFADNVNDVIWAMDFNGRYIFMSSSIQPLLGYTAEEAVGLSVEDTLTPEAAATARSHIEQIVAAAQAGERIQGGTLELEQVRKDGSTVMTEVSYSGMYDESGRLIAIQGVGRDITSRKQVEEDRILATQRMESLLALSRMADRPMEEITATVVEDAIRMTQSTLGYMALMNDDESVLTIQYWSKSARAECKINDHPFVYPIETTGLWGEAVRQRRPVVTNDYAAPNPLKRGMPEGHMPIVRHMNIPVFDGRRIVAVAGIANKSSDYDERDLRQLQLLMDGWWRIATQKQYELNLAKARDEAEAANRAKSQFLATMSHEIRTPMTAILGYAELLMDPTIGESARNNYAATICRSGEHLLSLINDILDLSKIEAGKVTLEYGHCRLVAMLAEVASLLRPRAVVRGISFSVEYPGPLPETIHTDAARLRQTVVNLAGNAVKFTEKGSVRIVASFLPDWAGGPAVRIDVIDTGIGISKETLPLLFRPFSQGDASVTRRFGGTGLGLAISHHLAQLLGGELTVQSELGQGSAFTLTIPTGSLDGVAMIQNPAEATLEDFAKNWTSEMDDLRGADILLAEDGLDNRELIEAVLRRAGAKVETAENGRIALEKASRHSFDLILMDMNMPEMDGYQATSLLRDRGYRGPIVALTANAMIGDNERCRTAGCNLYLTKPIDRPLLIQTIAAFVKAKAAPTHVASELRIMQPPLSRTAIASVPKPETSGDGEEPIISEFIDDPDMAPIIRRFVERLDDQLDAMHRSLANREHEELRRLAHKLKGAGGSYGFPMLTEAGKALEDAARMQDDGAEIAAIETITMLVRRIPKKLVAVSAADTPSPNL